MVLYESMRVLMSLYGSLWVFIGFVRPHGSLLVLVRAYVSVWVLTNLYSPL